jgi:tetratricopeptide (TPR) repeat protein
VPEKVESAVTLFQRALEKDPNASSNLATAYFQMHRYADSAVQFEKAVQLDPKNYLSWGNLGDAYYWSPGRRTEAADAYGRAIALGK